MLERKMSLFGLDHHGNEVHEAIYNIDSYEEPIFEFRLVNSVPEDSNSTGVRIATVTGIQTVYFNKFTAEKAFAAYEHRGNDPKVSNTQLREIGLKFHKFRSPFGNSGVGVESIAALMQLRIVIPLFYTPFLFYLL